MALAVISETKLGKSSQHTYVGFQNYYEKDGKNLTFFYVYISVYVSTSFIHTQNFLMQFSLALKHCIYTYKKIYCTWKKNNLVMKKFLSNKFAHFIISLLAKFSPYKPMENDMNILMYILFLICYIWKNFNTRMYLCKIFEKKHIIYI